MPAPLDDLATTALHALAGAEPAGMTIPDLSAFVESRQGSTDEEAGDARSPQSRDMQAAIQALVSGSGSLVEQGLATDAGGVLHITPAGKDALGR